MCITSLLPVSSVPRFLQGARKLKARQFIFKLFFFSFVLFIITVLKKTITTNLRTKSRAQTFPSSLSAAGLVRPQSGDPKKIKNPISSALLRIGPVCTSLHYLCVPVHATFHLSVQTTSKPLKCSFVSGCIDQAVLLLT